MEFCSYIEVENVGSHKRFAFSHIDSIVCVKREIIYLCINLC